MICFDFKKKKECQESTILEALKNIKYIISPYEKLDADIADCNIIEWGRDPNLHVAFPPSALGCVTLEDVSFTHIYNEKWSGRINLPGKPQRNFSIQNQVLYIAKC